MDVKKIGKIPKVPQAALELLATRGLDAVTLVEVAEAADVGHRTLFPLLPR